MISYIIATVVGILIVVFDQLAKAYIVENYVLHQSHTFIDGLINIFYLHNTGGAAGILSGFTWLLLSISVVVMLICVSMLVKVGLKNKLMFWAITLVMSGGLGNMIDRFFREGVVVDFLQFAFWTEFPVFNIADCAIVIGAGLLIIYFITESVNESRNKQTLKTNIEKNEIKDE